MSQKKNNEKAEDIKMNAAIRYVCQQKLGVLDSGFFCQSLGILNLRPPLCVDDSAAIADVITVLKENKVGCVLAVNGVGELTGIFSERDCILKIIGTDIDIKNTTVASVMTRDPVAETADCTMAYALNLMSHGGFRHLPIIDQHNHPISLLSVKDVVDHIVTAFTQDLLGFSTEMHIEGLES